MCRYKLAILAAVISFAAAASADAKDKVALQLRWDHQFQFAGFYAANWKGYYDEAGLDVEIRAGIAPDGKMIGTIDEVVSGRAQFGIGEVGLVMARTQGKPVVVIASIFQQSPMAVIVRKDSGISAPSDLLNRRIRRVLEDPGPDAEFQAMMRAEGIDPRRVPILFANVSGRAIDLLINRDVDAYMGFYPGEVWRARHSGVEIARIRPANYGVNFYGDALFTSLALRNGNPGLLQRFKDASLRGWQYALEHRQEIADRIAAELPTVIPVRDRRGFERFLADNVADLMLYPNIEIGHTNPQRWLRMYEDLRQAQMVTGPFDAASFVFDPVQDQIAVNAAITRTAIIAGTGVTILLIGAVGWSWLLRYQVRKRTRELAESEERYALAVNGVDEGIWDWNILTNDDYLSPRWKSLLGFRDDELENKASSFFDRIHPDDVQVVNDVLEAHFKGEARYAVEIRLRHKDGSYRWFVSRGEALRDARTGRLVRMVGSIRDTTERKRVENELKEAKLMAEGVSKAKSAFIANMSHELRTPLNSILGFSELIKNETYGAIGERYRECANDISSSGAHLLSLINDLLDLSKLESGRFELSEQYVNASAIIQECKRLVELQAQKAGVQLLVTVDDALPLMRADDRRLRQVLINLLSNAVKFTPEGGRVTVSAFPVNQGLAMEVSDTGIGMAQEDIASALQPFRQIDNKLARKYQGIGLGLPIAKRLVEMHGGTFAIQSEVDVGTTITIMLPRERLVGWSEIDNGGRDRGRASLAAQG